LPKFFQEFIIQTQPPIFLKRFYRLLISLATGILLWASWVPSSFTLLIFVAWIPLLWLESKIKSKRRFFGYTYIAMFTWNILTTWWIWNASVPGAIAAFLANSLIMCLPWLGFKITKNKLGEKIGYCSLIPFWLCFEYIHLHDWGLSWPWLTLGNVFAEKITWIQWYEYTGTSGGSLWVMLVNLVLFFHLRQNTGIRKSYKYVFLAVILFGIPLAISKLIKPVNSFGSSEVVIIQPNIDPYEKIATGTFEAQLQKLISLSEKTIDGNTKLVVWPETALYVGNGIEESKMKENFFLNPLWGFLQRHPQITLFTGVESYRVYSTPETNTAKPAGEGFYYDAFNSSALIDSTGPINFYHKSMLVPGVETLPWFLRFIDKWFEKFGGTTAGYAKQKERTVLQDKRHALAIAPAICYESIYGEFMTKYIRNGANMICIVTNDGWWGNTPGYKQHLAYARLRAIETRKWVVRSANTGVSCFISPVGITIDPQPYNTAAAIKGFVLPNDSKTFYVKYGDLVSKLMAIASVGLVAWILSIWLISKFKNRKRPA
jgi:apolipoprotein N-acyltransferase